MYLGYNTMHNYTYYVLLLELLTLLYILQEVQ